jgi:hypothetical protein
LRDILTVLAAILILILGAAVVAPPFVDWQAHRELIDQAISDAAGVSAKTEGRIRLRLLPSPRVVVDGLTLGRADGEGPSLSASFVRAEMALTPLLSGKIRFAETRIGRAEIRIPIGADLHLPGSFVDPEVLHREWALEDLVVAQLLVTTVAPATGRTNQAYAENVRIVSQSIAGPWRMEGTTVGVPFRVVTGALAADRTLSLKLSGGGDIHPRFDIDAKVELGTHAGAIPAVSGSARLLFGPPAQVAAAGIPIPVSIQAGFRTAGATVELDPVAIEAGEGGASLRMTGSGAVRTGEPAVSLKLEGRRLDVDSFIMSAQGRDFAERWKNWRLPATSTPVDLDLSLNSVGLAQDEISNVRFRGVVRRGRAEIERLEMTAPGQTQITASGDVGLTSEGGGSGRIGLVSRASDRFARYLERLDLGGPHLTPLDGRPLEAAADVALAHPVASFRNMRLRIGDATMTGALRYTAAEGGDRARVDAQVGIQGLDLNDLPQLHGLAGVTETADLGLIVEARDVRQGNRPEVGRIAARVLSDGPSLVVETLEISNLAGANAQVRGRIEPDGSGRIAGKVVAKRAAPLLDLLGSVWIGGSSKLVPYFLREGDLNLDLVAERAAAPRSQDGLGLKTSLRGTAAGGLFEAEVLALDSRTETMSLRLATENTGVWVNRPDAPALRRPSSLELAGVRIGSGQFNVTAKGEVGGVKVTTTRPFGLSANDEVVDSGEADLSTSDVTPFLVLLGDGAGVEPPVPMQLKVTLGRERDRSLFDVSGRVAGSAVQARLSARSRSDLDGSVTLERLAAPWLAAAFALNAPPDPNATAAWSGARFGQTRRLLDGGRAAFKVAHLDLGRGLVAEDAGFTFEITPEGIMLRDLTAGLAGGRLTGTMAIARQGSQASFVGDGTIRDASIPALTGWPTIDGRLSATLRFGSSGETLVSVVSNLAGAGDVRLTNLALPNADPEALARAVPRLLREDDPLGGGRPQAIVTEELGRGPFRAPTVAASATMVGGTLRIGPIAADAGAAVWQGTAAVDLKTMAVDARGTLTARNRPTSWSAGQPYIQLAWRGSPRDLRREVDVGPLVNGLAAVVLQRELERVEAFEADANERLRSNQRLGMDRDRRAAAEAARRAAEAAEEQARAKAQAEVEEGRRQARLREQAEAERARAQREQTEAARAKEAERANAGKDRTWSGPAFGAPTDIRPPAQARPPGG